MNDVKYRLECKIETVVDAVRYCVSVRNDVDECGDVVPVTRIDDEQRCEAINGVQFFMWAEC